MEKIPVPGLLDSPSGRVEPGAARNSGSLAEWELGIVFIGLYLVVERVTFIHPWAATGITPWNPQLALVFALILARGVRSLPAVLVAMFISELLVRSATAGVSVALVCAALSAVGYTAAASMLSKQLSARARIRTLRDFAWTAGIAAVAPVAVGAAYVGANAAFGLVEWSNYLHVLLQFWIGDVVGILTLLPLVLLLALRSERRRLAAVIGRWETLLQLGSAAAILALMYFVMPAQNVKYFFLLFLPLIWIAARHGSIGAALAVACVELGLIVLVQVSNTGMGTLVELQARMLGLAVTGLLLGVVVDERERAQERLRQSLRLAAAGEMAAALAHEVNQPLTALVTYGRACEHMLAQSPQDLAKIEQTVAKLTEQAQRVAAIVKRLRDFLRSGTMNLERVAPGEFLATIQAAFAAEANRDGIALELRVAGDLPRVMVDRLELEIVLRNLVSNAMESIRESGVARREIVLDAACQSPGIVVMSVIDSGPGIPAEMRERLFTPFSTSKSHGMGLGLAISRAIVTAHGGRLWADAAPFGSFHLSLPTVTGDIDDLDC